MKPSLSKLKEEFNKKCLFGHCRDCERGETFCEGLQDETREELWSFIRKAYLLGKKEGKKEESRLWMLAGIPKPR